MFLFVFFVFFDTLQSLQKGGAMGRYVSACQAGEISIDQEDHTALQVLLDYVNENQGPNYSPLNIKRVAGILDLPLKHLRYFVNDHQDLQQMLDSYQLGHGLAHSGTFNGKGALIRRVRNGDPNSDEVVEAKQQISSMRRSYDHQRRGRTAESERRGVATAACKVIIYII